MINFATKDFKEGSGMNVMTLVFDNCIRVTVIDTGKAFLVSPKSAKFPQKLKQTLREVDDYLTQIRNYRRR